MPTEENEINSFAINKAITTSHLFSKLDLTSSAKLVLRCITDFWNFKLGYAYPTQATIMECTGLTEPSVVNAIKELCSIGLVYVDRKNKRNYYCFTLKFFSHVNLSPKNFLANTLKTFSNIPKNFLDNNILKEKENTRKKNLLNFSLEENRSSSNSETENEETAIVDEDEELTPGLAMAKAFVKNMHSSMFAEKKRELMEKYNLDENGEELVAPHPNPPQVGEGTLPANLFTPVSSPQPSPNGEGVCLEVLSDENGEVIGEDAKPRDG